MQATCPQCAHRMVIDDARVPDRPFAVRCPKCQATTRFPGRAAGGAPAAAPASSSPMTPGSDAAESASDPASAPPASEGTLSDEMRSALIAQLRREMSQGEPGHGRQVLVAVPDRGLAGALTMPLTRLGHTVEVLDTPEEGGRLLEDGVYDVVITNRTAAIPGRAETLYQRIARLSPESRRRIFLILVGAEFKTGDGTQAFAALADFVVNPRDASGVEPQLLNAMAERNRLYQVFLEVQRRHESPGA